MNVKKTLNTVVVWYDKDTGKVNLAKCRATGKFVKIEIAQAMLDAELKTVRLPSVKYGIVLLLFFSFFALFQDEFMTIACQNGSVASCDWLVYNKP